MEWLLFTDKKDKVRRAWPAAATLIKNGLHDDSYYLVCQNQNSHTREKELYLVGNLGAVKRWLDKGEAPEIPVNPGFELRKDATLKRVQKKPER